MIFSATHYLELHNAISFSNDVTFYQVKLLMWINAQTISLTFVSEKGDIQ